jgi:hypothetical protein
MAGRRRRPNPTNTEPSPAKEVGSGIGGDDKLRDVVASSLQEWNCEEILASTNALADVVIDEDQVAIIVGTKQVTSPVGSDRIDIGYLRTEGMSGEQCAGLAELIDSAPPQSRCRSRTGRTSRRVHSCYEQVRQGYRM